MMDENTRVRVDFMENEAPKIHKVFGVPTNYDKKRDRHLPRLNRPLDGMETELDDLQNAIEKYRRSVPEDEAQFALFPSEGCMWGDVFRHMEDARVQYEEKENRGLASLRKYWRRLGSHDVAEYIDPWFELIPDQFGLSVVRGGLVVILASARRSAENHGKILNYIVQVMDTVTTVCPRRRIFNRDDDIDACTKGLYAAVLSCVTSIIKYLLQRVERIDGSTIKNSVKDIFHPKGKGDRPKMDPVNLSRIDQEVEAVKSRAKEFSQLCNNYKEALFMDSYALQLESSDLQHKNTAKISKVSEDTAHIKLKIQDIYDKSPSSEDFRTILREELEKKEKAREERERNLLQEAFKDAVAVSAKNALNDLLKSHSTKIQVYREGQGFPLPTEPEMPRSRTPGHGPLSLITLEQLILCLGISLEMSNDDLEVVIQERTWLGEQAYGAAQSLLQTQQFRSWLLDAGSSLLVVNGCNLAHCNKTISAMSVLVVDIISSLLEPSKDLQHPVKVIYFFCGLHGDEQEGPVMMMRSLIMQLLLILRPYPSLNLSFINNEQWIHDLQAGHLEALLSTLRHLCQQIPSYLTVYCFVDGVSFYESEYLKFFEPMMAFVDGLHDIMRSSSFSAGGLLFTPEYYPPARPMLNFKVLLTSGNMTESLHKRVDSRSHITLGPSFGMPHQTDMNVLYNLA
ncbi:hypothetical protein F5B20DRAFT_564200 [Whalleya microplaca]|nr:hypothetical protein F5B20DRAFT_564200 [Whalleya microplaca]